MKKNYKRRRPDARSFFNRMPYNNISSATNTSKYPGFINAKTGKPCTPTSDAELEAILDRLDRMAQDVEQVCEAIVKRLELDLGTDRTYHLYVAYCTTKMLRVYVYKLYYLIKLHF